MARKKELLKNRFRSRYGYNWPPENDDAYIEQWCYLNDVQPPKGLGAYGHFQKWMALRWPDFEWNPWAQRIASALCSNEYAIVQGKQRFRCLSMVGCAAAGKTHTVGFFAYCWWSANPRNSACIITSTTKDMARKRQWPVVTWAHQNSVDCVTNEYDSMGIMQDSRSRIIWSRGDDKHGVFLQAVAAGETSKAIGNLKGIHAMRMLVIIDEAEFTPAAIFETIANMRKGCTDFTLVVIGNSRNHLDPHGRCCEPLKGWGSIAVDHEQWRTKGVPEWQIEPGLCLHFDGEKSPNVMAKKTRWPYLYTYENYESAQRQTVGGLEYRKTSRYYQHDRGFWTPEGIEDRLFTEAMFEQHGALGDHTFVSYSEIVGFLDPAFGGDKCVLVFGKIGDLPGERKGLLITEHHEIAVAAANEERDYQIARQAIALARDAGCEPDHFGCDATGIGRGVRAIMCAEWSSIIGLEFGSRASERPSGTADGRPAFEVYSNLVTEMWYGMADFVKSGQIAGVYPEAVIQFCARPVKQIGRRWILVSKQECKTLYQGGSPDDADAIAGLLEVARRHGLAPDYREGTAGRSTWNKIVQEAQQIATPTTVLEEVQDMDEYGRNDTPTIDLCDIGQ